MFKIGQQVTVTAKGTKHHGKIFTVRGYWNNKVRCRNDNFNDVYFEEDDLKLYEDKTV